MRFDLKELSQRESEQVEWKENVADVDDVIKTAVAFANDFSNLGGGYIVCGACEQKDEHGFQRIMLSGLTADRCKELENKVLSDCRTKVDPPVVPIIEEQQTEFPDRRILVFVVPASGSAHSYRAGGKDASTYYIRIGRETREARNGLLRELLVRKGALEPWDRRVNQVAQVADIDPLLLRDTLNQIGLWDPNRAFDDYLSSDFRLSTFTPPLAGRVPLTDRVHPRNFTLLMFGKEPTRFFPGAYVAFSIYRGKDRSEPTAERNTIMGTIGNQARKLIDLLNAEAYVAFDKTDEMPNQVKYPLRALQEAVVNSLVHRDYESDQPTRVTVFSDRIEINSPGTLPRTMTPDQFRQGKASPFWRNQALAYFFNKLQLAQAEGQGIPTILRAMREEGCPEPVFEINPESVICILPAHPRHEAIRELARIENKLILGQHEEALRDIEALLDHDPLNFRSLELFCEIVNMLKRPRLVFDFIQKHGLRPAQINTGTVIVVASTLSKVDGDHAVRNVAEEWLSHVSHAQLELAEVKRIALSYRKVGNDDEAIKLIDDFMGRSPAAAQHSSLLDIRGRARIDLAKRCIETARSSELSPTLRGKAWDRCREYLAQAESDLRKALEYVKNQTDKDYIEKDLEFLSTMKSFAQRPPMRPKGTAWRGHRGSR